MRLSILLGGGSWAERVISRHVGRPVPVAMKACGRHVGIMIARHHAHIGRPPQGFEPAAGEREFGRERDVDEIARDGHVVRLLAVKIACDGVERIATMDAMTAAPPIDVADEALGREFPHARLRQRPEMRIGQVRQHEWFAHSPLARNNVTPHHVIRDHWFVPPS